MDMWGMGGFAYAYASLIYGRGKPWEIKRTKELLEEGKKEKKKKLKKK